MKLGRALGSRLSLKEQDYAVASACRSQKDRRLLLTVTKIAHYPKMVIIWDGAIVFALFDSRSGNQRNPVLQKPSPRPTRSDGQNLSWCLSAH